MSDPTTHPIREGTTWASPQRTRLITELWPARGASEAAVRYREGGLHRTISLRSFRDWISKERAGVIPTVV